MNKKKCIGIIVIILYICNIGVWFIYYNRPIIPFMFVSPYITWRTYEMDKEYKLINTSSFKRDILTKLGVERCILKRNDYPYYVNAKHYVLWCKNRRMNVDYELSNYFDMNKYSIKWFENPSSLKSIPEILHYHVFVKEKQLLE